MSSSSQPEETHLDTPVVEFANMDVLPTLDTIDLDSLMFTPTMGTTFIPDELQTASPFSPGHYGMGGDLPLTADSQGAVSSGEPTFHTLAYQDPIFHQTVSAPVDTETSTLLQQLTAQIQSLSTRVQYLETSHQQSCETVGYTALRVQYLASSVQKANSAVEDFAAWSKGIEKYCRDQTRTVLDLVGMVQKADSATGDDESLSSGTTPTA